MFILYNLLLTLLSPIWVPWMWLRSRRRKEAPNWQERCGNYPFKGGRDTKRIWVHAVSVGEVMACKPILRELREVLPDYEIVLSTTTSSGHRTASEHAVGLYDHLVYFPIDVARFQLAAMTRVRPAAVAIMETELWMNFLWAAKAMGAKTLLVNGRISDRSFGRSRKLAFFYGAMFKMLDRVLAQSDGDREKLLALGASKVEVLGNCKFDQALEGLTADPAAVRKSLKIPAGRKVVVVGSTRGEDEESLVIAALKEVGLHDLMVIHAPRHLERVGALAVAVEEAFGRACRRSAGESGDYLILDTYGELADVYSVADLVIVGGGFGEYGGQNILQPLALGKPVLHGPHMQNFKDVAESAGSAGATRVCSNASQLAEAIKDLLADDVKRNRMGLAAAELIKASTGASKRYAEAIASEVLQTSAVR